VIGGADFAVNLLSNVASNALCIGIPLLIVFITYHLRARRWVRRFFGIADRRGATVQMRLSNIYVKPAGTLSPLSIGRGFVGPAINAAEYQYALETASAVQSHPLAGAAYALFEQFGVKAVDRPVMCKISPSLDYVRVPHQRAHEHQPVDFSTDQAMVAAIRRTLAAHESFVLVGSPVYNVLTYYVLTNCGDQMRVRFVEAKTEPGHTASGIEILRFHQNGASHLFERRLTEGADGTVTHEEYFVLQKITNWNGSPTTIFVCAGTSTAATAAALAKLSNWRTLAAEFGMGPFTLVCAVHTADREMSGTSDERAAPWTVVRIWPSEH
jgi:hypothetical protein